MSVKSVKSVKSVMKPVSEIKEFNRSMKLFIMELMENFPHVELVKVLHTTFIVSKKLNKRIPRRMFNSMLAMPYRTELSNRDDAFFTSKDFTFICWQSLIESAKTVWISLDELNKNAIWEHLTLLCRINQKISGQLDGDDIDAQI